jgi:hypothetical protein
MLDGACAEVEKVGGLLAAHVATEEIDDVAFPRSQDGLRPARPTTPRRRRPPRHSAALAVAPKRGE